MLNIHMLRDAMGEPDARGDRRIFPKGAVVEADDDAAGYLVAMGYAETVGQWPDVMLAGVETLKSLVIEFRAKRIEPTQRDVYLAVAALQAELAKQEPAPNAPAAANENADLPAASSGDQPPEPPPASPRVRRKH